MSAKNLEISDHKPGIRVVTVNRPKALNALNTDTLGELTKVLSEAAEDRSVRVLVLTGSGGKAFIAGADIVEMKDKSPEEGEEFAKLGQEVTLLLERMPKPTIAAVNGFALGGGTEMAISCDFIWASENAVFGQPEVGLGILTGFGATARLPKFVGYPAAKDLIFSGRKVKAEEARAMGLASRLFPAKGFMDAVLKEASKISRNSTTAVKAAKELLNEFSEHCGLNDKLTREARSFGSLFGTPDQKEGMGAFVEKRKPKFSGLEENR